jgi:hypothetical protein
MDSLMVPGMKRGFTRNDRYDRMVIKIFTSIHSNCPYDFIHIKAAVAKAATEAIGDVEYSSGIA